MSIEAVAKIIRQMLAGSQASFAFEPCTQAPEAAECRQARHLYVHVPFCRHQCPYCPYNKVPYHQAWADRYFQALHREIERYSSAKPPQPVESLYFGGGSPSLFPHALGTIITRLRKQYDLRDRCCVEIHPQDCDEKTLDALSEAGITTVSLGVQSFHDAPLQAIGRSYTGDTARQAVKRVRKRFPTMNVDLMFALPGGNARQVQEDGDIATDLGSDQITAYPLFTFPYSTVGSYRQLKQVKMPKLHERRKQYYVLYDRMLEHGFSRVSVWSFMRGHAARYSSVTRHGYLGFGAGAGTHLSDGYYLNTFSVPAYIECLEQNRSPTALKWTLSAHLDNLFWLYWRFYDTDIPRQEFERRFPKHSAIRWLPRVMQATGCLVPTSNHFTLTRHGSFWLHLAQNYFALQSINAVWTHALRDPFPQSIPF